MHFFFKFTVDSKAVVTAFNFYCFLVMKIVVIMVTGYDRSGHLPCLDIQNMGKELRHQLCLGASRD